MKIVRFEKSLYDLIRGMRHQTGHEDAYIQASLKECRKEIKGQDMSRSTKCSAVIMCLRLLRPEGNCLTEVDLPGNVWV
jgi:hypothetical protein